jgi:hypothetical protein
MWDVNFNMSSQDENDFEDDTIYDSNEHEISGMHGNNTNGIFRDVNNNSLE